MTRAISAAVLAAVLATPVLGQPPAADCGAACDSPPGWVSVDFLLGWVRGDPLPILVTTSPAGTARAAAGVLQQPGTTILYGGGPGNGDTRTRLRFGAGYRLCDEHGLG